VFLFLMLEDTIYETVNPDIWTNTNNAKSGRCCSRCGKRFIRCGNDSEMNETRDLFPLTSAIVAGSSNDSSNMLVVKVVELVFQC
jgi:hypothetical protein